jgi:hypothetical protein
MYIDIHGIPLIVRTFIRRSMLCFMPCSLRVNGDIDIILCDDRTHAKQEQNMISHHCPWRFLLKLTATAVLMRNVELQFIDLAGIPYHHDIIENSETTVTYVDSHIFDCIQWLVSNNIELLTDNTDLCL